MFEDTRCRREMLMDQQHLLTFMLHKQRPPTSTWQSGHPDVSNPGIESTQDVSTTCAALTDQILDPNII